MSKRIAMLLAPCLAMGALGGGCGAPSAEETTLQSLALISPNGEFYNADSDVISALTAADSEPLEWYMGGLYTGITAVAESGRTAAKLRHSNAWCYSGIASNALLTQVQGPGVVRFVAKSDAPAAALAHKFVVFDANDTKVSETLIASNTFATYEVEIGPGTQKLMWTDARSAEDSRCDWSVFVDEFQVLPIVPVATVEAGADMPGRWVVFPGNGGVSKSTESHDGFGSMKITHANGWCFGGGPSVETETKVVGPGKLSFWAKTDLPEDGAIHMMGVFNEAGTQIASVTGLLTTSWEYFEEDLGPGIFTVRWLGGQSREDSRCSWSVFMDEFKVANDQLFAPTTGDIVIEAETYKESRSRGDVHKWSTATSVAGASGGAYVETVETHAALGTWETAAELTYDVSVALPGTYRVWMRVAASTWSDDSAIVGVDGLALGTRIDNAGPSSGWRWVQNATNTVLSAGTHTLSLRRREDGYKVDKIVLTTDAGFASRLNETLAEAPRSRPRAIALGGLAVMEAETFSSQVATLDPGGLSWTPGSALGGAVGSYVDTVSASFSVASESNGAALSYEVFVPSTGVFTVWVRRFAPNGSSNSVFATLNGAPSTLFDNVGSASAWVWKSLGTVTVASAGNQSVRLVRREPNYKVDRLLLSSDPAFVPSGDGPAASPR